MPEQKTPQTPAPAAKKAASGRTHGKPVPLAENRVSKKARLQVDCDDCLEPIDMESDDMVNYTVDGRERYFCDGDCYANALKKDAAGAAEVDQEHDRDHAPSQQVRHTQVMVCASTERILL